MKKEAEIIVVAGPKGTGKTAFCFAAANYFQSGEQRKTAYAELGEETQLSAMMTPDLLMDRTEKEFSEPGFLYAGISVFPALTADQARRLTHWDYEVLLVDAGEDAEAFYGCRVFFLGSLCPWKQKEYYRFMKKMYHSGISGTCLGIIPNEKERSKFTQAFGCQIRDIPRVRDPFLLSSSERQQLESILSAERRKKKGKIHLSRRQFIN